MGAKLPDGQYTTTPTSPGGPSRLCSVTGAGNAYNDGGVSYLWDASQGVYRARVPPPMGPWKFVEFTPEEGFMAYEMVPEGHSIPVEQGKAYLNGP